MKMKTLITCMGYVCVFVIFKLVRTSLVSLDTSKSKWHKREKYTPHKHAIYIKKYTYFKVISTYKTKQQLFNILHSAIIK